MKPEFLSIGDILKLKRKELVIIEDDTIVFVKHRYEIELTRIKNRTDIIQWLHHMMGKNWVTVEMLEQFIEKVCAYRGLEIYP